MEDPIPQRERAILGVKRSGAMEHSTVSCAITAEPIDMLFWMKTWVSPRNHVLDEGADAQQEGAIFGGCLRHSKALTIFDAAVAAAFTAKGIIMSCSRRDHSVCQASANRYPENFGHKRCGLSASKGVVGVHSASKV